jgi:hypothetical protein
MKQIKSSPVVVYLKTGKAAINRADPEPKRGPEPFHKGCREEGPPAVRKEVDPDSHRSAWVSAFGKRLKIDEQKGFYLDGRPISLDALMLETNRIRKAHGLAAVGRNPKWIP